MLVSQQLITILMAVIATMLTRFIPFIVFPTTEKTPEYVKYLGTVLPGAIFALLVVYCIKDVNVLGGSHGIPELIGILVTVLLHKWKRQMILSIAGGTLVYMILVQFIFI